MSLIVTASYARHADTSSYSATSSYIINNNTITNTAFTSSYLLTSSFNSVSNSISNSLVSHANQLTSLESFTSSCITNSETSSMNVLSASYSITASYALNGGGTPNNGFTSSYLLTSSFNTFTSSVNNQLLSLESVTSSYINNTAFTSSYLLTSSFNSVSNSISNSLVSHTNQLLSLESATSSYITNTGFTSSYLLTSSFNSISSSISNSLVSHANQINALELASSSYVTNSETSSMSVLSSSYSVTASYALNGGGGGLTNNGFTSSYLLTSSYNADSSSVSNSIVSLNNQVFSLEAWTGSVQTEINDVPILFGEVTSLNAQVLSLENSTGSYLQTSSFNTISSSISNSLVSINNQIISIENATSSYVKNSQTSSMTVATASYWSGSIINAASSSYSSTASYYNGTIISSSYALSSSYSSTASYVASSSYSSTASYYNGTIISSSYALSSSYSSNSNSSSYSITSSFSNNSNNSLSSSYSATASYISNPIYDYRNRIINGDMVINQRGNTSVTSTVGYFIDRYYASASGANVTLNQISGGLFGVCQYACAITGAASNTNIVLGQKIESANIYDQSSGSGLTLSAYISSTYSSSVTWIAYYPTVQDNWASRQVIASGSWTTTSTMTRYSASITTASLSNIINGMSIEFSSSLNSTAKTITLTGIQLEPSYNSNGIPTQFEKIPYSTILTLCQRYCQTTYDTGTVPGTATHIGLVGGITYTNSYYGGTTLYLSVPLRNTSPLISYWDGAGHASEYSQYINGSWVDNAGAVTIVVSSTKSIIIYTGSGAGSYIHYIVTSEL